MAVLFHCLYTPFLLQAIEKVKPPPQAGKWRFEVVRNEQGLISSVKAVRE